MKTQPGERPQKKSASGIVGKYISVVYATSLWYLLRRPEQTHAPLKGAFVGHTTAGTAGVGLGCSWATWDNGAQGLENQQELTSCLLLLILSVPVLPAPSSCTRQETALPFPTSSFTTKEVVSLLVYKLLWTGFDWPGLGHCPLQGH